MKSLVFAFAALIFGFNASAITVNKKCTGLPTQEWDRDAKGKLNYKGEFKGMIINVQLNDKAIVVNDPAGYFQGQFDAVKGGGMFPAPVNQEYVGYYGQIDDSYDLKVQKSLLQAGGSGIIHITVYAEGNSFGIFSCEDVP